MLFGAILTKLQLTWGIQPCYGEQRHRAGNKDMGQGIQKIWQGTTSFSTVALKSMQDPFSQFLIIMHWNNPLIPAWLTGPQHGLEQSVTSMWDAQLLLVKQGGQVTTSMLGFTVKWGMVIGIAWHLTSLLFTPIPDSTFQAAITSSQKLGTTFCLCMPPTTPSYWFVTYHGNKSAIWLEVMECLSILSTLFVSVGPIDSHVQHPPYNFTPYISMPWTLTPDCQSCASLASTAYHFQNVLIAGGPHSQPKIVPFKFLQGTGKFPQNASGGDAEVDNTPAPFSPADFMACSGGVELDEPGDPFEIAISHLCTKLCEFERISHDVSCFNMQVIWWS